MRALALVLALALAPPAAADHADPFPYRMDDYRAPVPATVPGGIVLDTEAAEALWKAGGAVWIDVLPAPRRPDNLPPQALWLPIPRRDIPGSLWLPDVGRGALGAATEAYFRTHLDAAAGGRREMPVVFYCLSRCWMSWNAAKRAASWGYARVYWYPDGTDGWEAAGLPLAEAEPAPGS